MENYHFALAAGVGICCAVAGLSLLATLGIALVTGAVVYVIDMGAFK